MLCGRSNRFLSDGDDDYILRQEIYHHGPKKDYSMGCMGCRIVFLLVEKIG